MHPPGHVAVTDEKAPDEFWPRYLEVIRNYSKIRGFAVPTKDSFLYEVGPQGALYVGSYGMGGLSHEALMKNIELYGTQVIPRVRELLA